MTRWPCQALLITLTLTVAGGTLQAGLPQRHEYQKTLKSYLAKLTENDFKLTLKPVRYVLGEIGSADKVYRLWLLAGSRSWFPSTDGLRAPARHFTLGAIEKGGGVHLGAGRGLYTAWWSQWDYSGNPYYRSRAVKLRAFVLAAVDLMMLDNEHDNGRNKRSDYLGGSTIRHGYVFGVVKSELPKPIQAAYATGLKKMFTRLTQWTPHGMGGSDMEFFQLVGMYYAAQAIGGPALPAKALKRAHYVIDRVTSKTGYEKHGNAFDVSYQGIALCFLTWAAHLYRDAKVTRALDKMLVLKSHLTLPEPDGVESGPTHFSTGTSMDAPHDQWAWYFRDVAMAMLSDKALYTIRSAEPKRPSRDKFKVLDTKTMKAEIRATIKNKLGKAITQPLTKDPGTWKENHWARPLPYAYDCYQKGFYQKIKRLARQNSPLMLPPFARGKQFIRDLNGGGEFLAARFKDYGAVIHSGAIASKWAKGVSGKSGGSLSAFWMPGRGSVILGRCRATQGGTPDEWTDAKGRGPLRWAVHAITGKGQGGRYFSTARIRQITAKYTVSGTNKAVVHVMGKLAASKYADPHDVLRGKAIYQRRFELDRNGITVTSSLSTNRRDRVAELYEVIPLYLGNAYYHRNVPFATVEFFVDRKWRQAGGTAVTAQRVRVGRYKKYGYIIFEQPQVLRVSPQFGRAGEMNGARFHNLLIDLLPGKGKGTMLKSTSVRYTISPRNIPATRK